METLLKNKRPPVIPLLGAPGVQLSRTTFRENLSNPEIQFKTLALLLERFQPDGMFPMMDLSVEAEALGLKIEFPENANPSVREHPIKDRDSLESLKRNAKPMSGRMPVFVEVVRRMKQSFPILVGGYVIGPFTLAGELAGVEDFLEMLITNPSLAKEILSFTTDFLTRYAEELFSAGADVVAILDPTSVTLSPKYYNEFSAPYVRELVERLGKPIILHICGNTNHLLEAMVETGAVGLSLDSMVDLREAAERVPKDVALIGNLDPVNVFLRGTPEIVERRTRELVERMMGVENFILSSGCDIPIEAPLENISAFMRAGRGL
jgi:uroporphyrinogen decarboxylase